MHPRRLWPAIDDGDLHQHVVRRRFGVFDEHIEITVLVEDPRVGQLELRLRQSALPALLQQPPIRELRLRILVQHPHIRMRRRPIEVVIHLLDVPRRDCPLRWSARTGAPSGTDRARSTAPRRSTSSAARHPSRRCRPHPTDTPGSAPGRACEIVPGVAIRAIILADRAPLPVADIRSPSSPALSARRRLQPQAFGRLQDRSCCHEVPSVENERAKAVRPTD